MNAAVGGAGILSVLDLLLKFNMTKVRVAGVAAGIGPSTAANLAAEAMAANFQRWHDLQLNIAEYTPTFVGLMLYLTMRQRMKQKESWRDETLTTLQRVACWAATVTQLSFAAGYILMSPTATSPHPLRAFGAIGRYVSYALLIVAAIKTK